MREQRININHVRYKIETDLLLNEHGSYNLIPLK